MAEFVDPIKVQSPPTGYGAYEQQPVTTLYTCSVCCALVMSDYTEAHDRWHTEQGHVQTPCTCGWGGTHDPDNPKCERNQQ